MIYLFKLLKQVYTSVYVCPFSVLFMKNILYSLWFVSADSITPESTGETNILVPLQPLYWPIKKTVLLMYRCQDHKLLSLGILKDHKLLSSGILKYQRPDPTSAGKGPMTTVTAESPNPRWSPTNPDDATSVQLMSEVSTNHASHAE